MRQGPHIPQGGGGEKDEDENGITDRHPLLRILLVLLLFDPEGSESRHVKERHDDPSPKPLLELLRRMEPCLEQTTKRFGSPNVSWKSS